MKEGTISIGSKDFGKAREISVTIKKAEDVADTVELATAQPVTDELREALAEIPADVQALLAGKFMRAYAIALQDGHLRPMYHDGERDVAIFQAKATELQTLPLKSIKARGRPVKATEVKVEEGKTYTAEQLKALFANVKGVKLV